MNLRGEDSLLAEPKFAAYFLLPVTVALPLDTDSSYAFIEDVNCLEYLSARRTDPNVDIDFLRRTAKKHEASIWIHPKPSMTPDWKLVVRTALPWLPAAAADAMPVNRSPAACVIEGCVPMDTLRPPEHELQDALDYLIDCIRRLRPSADAPKRAAMQHVGRHTLPESIGVALAQVSEGHPPITGHPASVGTRRQRNALHDSDTGSIHNECRERQDAVSALSEVPHGSWAEE